MFEDIVELAIKAAVRRWPLTAGQVVADDNVYRQSMQRSSNPILFGHNRVIAMIRQGILYSKEGKLYVS